MASETSHRAALWLLPFVVLDGLLCYVARRGVWGPFGYSMSVAPSPGEAGAAVMMAMVMAFVLLVVWTLSLVTLLLVRYFAKRRGNPLPAWATWCFMLAHLATAAVIVRPFL